MSAYELAEQDGMDEEDDDVMKTETKAECDQGSRPEQSDTTSISEQTGEIDEIHKESSPELESTQRPLIGREFGSFRKGKLSEQKRFAGEKSKDIQLDETAAIAHIALIRQLQLK